MNFIELFNSFDLSRSDGSFFFSAIVAVSYGLAVAAIARRLKGLRAKRENAFMEALRNSLEFDELPSFSNVENMYLAATSAASGELVNKSRLATHLRKMILELYAKKRWTDGEVSRSTFARKIELLSEFIAIAEAAAPYGDLPDLERSLIQDAEAFLAGTDYDGVRKKLEELSQAILVREDGFQKLQKLNRWTTALSILGFVSTVSFGLVSLI